MKQLSFFYLMLLLMPACVSNTGGEIPYLFVKTPKAGFSHAVTDRNVSNTINVSDLNLALLKDSSIKQIKLPMPGIDDIVIVLDSLKHHKQATDWIGRIRDYNYSSVFLTFTDRALHGRITTKKDTYRINYTGNDVYQVALLDQSKMIDAPDDAEPGKIDTTRKKNNKATVECGDQPSSIDVMVVYTPAAENNAGGPDGMAALINQCISYTNTAYNNSGIFQQINLVHMEKVDYTESGNSLTDRNALQNPNDGVLDNVPVLRNLYNADLVVLIVDSLEPGICGRAFILDPVDPSQEANGYAVVKRACAVDNLSFPHELGHLMGARHEDDPTTTPFPYCHGYQVLAPADPTTPPWRTIMSRAPNTLRQPFFSNPNIRYPGGSTANGDPTGTTDQADNHQVLNNTAITVARYRCSTSTQSNTSQ